MEKTKKIGVFRHLFHDTAAAVTHFTGRNRPTSLLERQCAASGTEGGRCDGDALLLLLAGGRSRRRQYYYCCCCRFAAVNSIFSLCFSPGPRRHRAAAGHPILGQLKNGRSAANAVAESHRGGYFERIYFFYVTSPPQDRSKSRTPRRTVFSVFSPIRRRDDLEICSSSSFVYTFGRRFTTRTCVFFFLRFRKTRKN